MRKSTFDLRSGSANNLRQFTMVKTMPVDTDNKCSTRGCQGHHRDVNPLSPDRQGKRRRFPNIQTNIPRIDHLAKRNIMLRNRGNL